MPNYDYICQACGTKHEIFQSIKEGRKRKCPKCGALKLKRQIGTGGGIIFRGTPGNSGFYSLDYRDNTDGKNEKN